MMTMMVVMVIKYVYKTIITITITNCVKRNWNHVTNTEKKAETGKKWKNAWESENRKIGTSGRQKCAVLVSTRSAKVELNSKTGALDDDGGRFTPAHYDKNPDSLCTFFFI